MGRLHGASAVEHTLDNWASDVSGGRESGNRGREGTGPGHGGLECQGMGFSSVHTTQTPDAHPQRHEAGLEYSQRMFRMYLLNMNPDWLRTLNLSLSLSSLPSCC